MIEYARHPGAFVKHCPCSPRSVSCGYHNLNLHTGCVFSCTYCILQDYLDSKTPVFFSNWKDMERELEGFARERKHLRLGSGELSDSLVFEPEAGYVPRLIELFRRFPEVVFEFKTKSAEIGNLLISRDVPRNIVVSWSLTPEEIRRTEEKDAPTLGRRIRAMTKVQEAGFRVGIHLDPLLMIGDWRAAYADLVGSLRSTLRPDRIAWISLGGLRFTSSLRRHILGHRGSRIFEGELLKGSDGKYRYFRPLRADLFRHVKQQIKRHWSEEIPLYLCMEGEDMWRDVLPECTPREIHINRYLYEAVFR